MNLRLRVLNSLFPNSLEVLVREDQIEDARTRGYLIERYPTLRGVEYRAATPEFVEQLNARGVIHRYR